jgi:hypothetical protein
MISELTFIREYTSFWDKLFPSSKHYILAINSVLSTEVFEELSISEEDTKRRALVNNVAFSLFNLLNQKSIIISELDKLNFESQDMLSIVEVERKRLGNSRFEDKLAANLDESEQKVIIALSERLFEYYSRKSNVIVNPYFKGIGLLNSAEGDIFYENTLSEVKAGSGKFKTQDLRQLYTYLALNYNSVNRRNIEIIELFNPRTGIVWEGNIDDVSQNLSGMSTEEILNEIIFYISEEFKSI